MSNFWEINALAQIATALVLIVILLMYIAYKLSEGKLRSHKSSKRSFK